MDYIKRCRVIERLSKLAYSLGGETVTIDGREVTVSEICKEAMDELEEVIEDG